MGMRSATAALATACLVASGPAAVGEQARAVDGDTFVLDGEAIGIAGIDAPSSREPRCESEQILGLKAKARLRELLAFGSIRVERQGHDLRGTTVARTSAGGGFDVGRRLLDEGFALEDKPGREAELARVRIWCGRSAGLEDTFETVPLPKPRPSTP